MNLPELLTELSRLDVNIVLEGEQLSLVAPKGVMTPALRDALGKHKAKLISMLGQDSLDLGQVPLPAIVPDPERRYQPFPLTDIQQAYWVGRRGIFELGKVSTHLYIEFEGDNVDLELVSGAWQQLIKRHEMLRAVVLASGEQQILAQVPAYEIKILNLQGVDPKSTTAQLESVRREMSHQVLAADTWPLFELRASCLNQQRTRLHLSLDILMVDMGSIMRLFQEWNQLYQNPNLVLPGLELSFRDYVLAEQAMQDTPLHQQSWEYWLKRLDELPPAPELPLAQNSEALKQHRFKRYQAQLTSQTWQQLKKRGAQVGLTPSGILLAAFAEILSGWSKSPRFSLNLTLFNRLPLHAQVHDIVGDFTSILLLGLDNSTNESFSGRALRLQQQLRQDLEQRHVSGVDVLREMTRRQGGNHGVVMPIVFTSALALNSVFGQSNLHLNIFGEKVYSITQTPQMWLDHQVFEQDGCLIFNWDVVEGIFPEGLISDMFEAYGYFLEQLAASDEAWQATRRRLTPSAQIKQQTAVNSTQVAIPGGLLHNGFESQTYHHPQRTAVISSKRTLTYQELDDHANWVGDQLQQLDVRPNTLVAVMMEKGWEQIVAVLGILKSGGAYLPIDPELPQERRWYLLKHGQVRLILTQPKFEQQLAWPEGIQRLCITDNNPIQEASGHLKAIQTPTDLAYIIFTSGSTGLPKGVMIDHQGALNTITDVNQRFDVGPTDRVLALSSLSFDLSVYDIFGLLAAGGAIVMPDAAMQKEPGHWAELLIQQRVTLWNTVPALMQMLVDHLSEYIKPWPDFLGLIMLSGDWIPISLPDRIKALWPKAALVSLGGATEASIWSILYPIETVEPSWSSIPYGKPMMNQQFYVLDEALETRPVWVPGQLYIGGIGLAKGYWRDEEKSKASFIIHPHTQARLYKTGDLGRYLPDGKIEFLGREDFQVKIRGHRIELGEIEATLRQHANVTEAVVEAVGKSRHNKQLVAYIVANQERERADAVKTQQRWQALVEAGRRQAQQTSEGQDMQTFLTQAEEMDGVYPQAVCRALVKLGVYHSAGEIYDVDTVLARCRIASRYRKWIYRALKVLVEEGWLRQDGEQFESVVALSTIKLPEPSAESKNKPYFDFIKSAQYLAELITEQMHSAEIYVSEQTQSGLHTSIRFCSIIIREIMHTIVQSLEPGKEINILEVGAGYGATTTYVLPLLPPQQTTYTFTDLSLFFLERAKEEFAAYPFIQYDLLDLDKDPQTQGYAAHTFEVVIAAGVLHNTRLIKETMHYLRSVLAPGGILIMVEGTKFFRWFDLMMGLHQGFDRFEDEELRPNHPLLSREQWQSLLSSVGFETSVVLNQPGTVSDLIGFDVLVAQGPSEVTWFKPEVLRDFLSQKLSAYMVPGSFMCLDALPLTANGKVDRKALPEVGMSQTKPEAVYHPPTTEMEHTLAKIIQEILQIERVGIDHKFLEMGIDSLRMVQIQTKLKAALAKNVPIVEMFNNPTIKLLAKYLGQTQLKNPSFEQVSNRADKRRAKRRKRFLDKE